MATATLQYRVNGGALHTDSIAVASGDVIALTAASFAGWGTPAARWEIVAYPPDWAVPSGWSTDASSGFYYYLANSGGSGVVPPSITIPDPATTWGKWLFRLTVNGTIVSATIGVETISPKLGLHDLAVGEGSQFGDKRQWVGDQQENERLIEDATLVAGSLVTSITATSPIHIDVPFGDVTLSWLAGGDVPMSSHKITGLADPSSAQDAATKAYVDSVAAGLDPKASVLAATTANITLSGAQTIDGVSVTAGKRVLVKDQSTGSQNGFYLCAAGSWSRTTDLAAGASAAGTFCFVEQGSTNGDKGFVCTSDVGSDVVGTDALTFALFTATSSGLDASTHVLEDASTALNANGVPIRALGATLGFLRSGGAPASFTHKAASSGSVVEALGIAQTITGGGGAAAGGEGVKAIFRLPDGLAALTDVASVRAQYTTVVGATVSSKLVWQTISGGTLADKMTLSASGNLTATAFLGASLDTASAGALTLGGTNATSIAASSLRITGLTAGNASGHAVEYDQLNTALGSYVPTSRTLTGTSPITIAGDNSAHDLSADRTIAFSVAADVSWNSHKITGLANGSSAQDAAAFGQIATAVNAAVMGTSGKVPKFTGTNAVGDSTISDDGTNVSITGSFTAGTGGFIGVSINRASSGTFTVGSNITTLAATALAMTGIASVANAGSTIGIGTGTETAISIGNGTITITTTGLLDTIYAGIANVATHGRQLRNTTASTAGVTVQRGPSDRWEGHARVSGADRAMYADFELLPRTSGAVDLTFKYNNSGSDNTAFRYTTSTSSQFTAALECSAFSCTLGSAGFFFDADAGGMYRGGSGGVQIYSAASGDPGVFHADVTGSTDPIRIWASGETKGATKAIVCFGDGTSWTQRARIAGDGTWEGSIVRNTASKTSNYTAALYELVEYSVAGGTFTVTTPTPASGKTGQLLITKNIGSNGTPLSITTPSGNIDNAATIKVAGGYACDTMVSDGSNGWLRISALRPWNFTATKTSAYTTAVGEVVKCDPSGGGFTVTLPPVPTTNTLREIDIIIKNVTSSTNTITIAPDGSDTIDGAASATITTARGVVSLLALAGGTDWLVL